MVTWEAGEENPMPLVHTDTRGRLSLGRLIESDRDYRVSINEHGALLLEPVTAMTDFERELLRRPTELRNLDAALATPLSEYLPAPHIQR